MVIIIQRNIHASCPRLHFYYFPFSYYIRSVYSYMQLMKQKIEMLSRSARSPELLQHTRAKHLPISMEHNSLHHILQHDKHFCNYIKGCNCAIIFINIRSVLYRCYGVSSRKKQIFLTLSIDTNKPLITCYLRQYI